jgi:hypothetical protein
MDRSLGEGNPEGVTLNSLAIEAYTGNVNQWGMSISKLLLDNYFSQTNSLVPNPRR